MFDIRSYGASENALNTTAIQAAIDDCAAQGGGTVSVPAGIWRTGTIWLRSHVELRLEHGSVLLASENLEDYNDENAYPQNSGCAEEEWVGKHLIIAHEIEDAAITGSGTIDGSAQAFFAEPIFYAHYCWVDGLALSKNKQALRPGQVVAFIECRDVRVEGITLRNTTCWNLFFHGCENVSVRGARVFNPTTYANTDGIDIDCCTRVTISDCIIDTGDDCIAIRGSSAKLKDPTKKCQYVTVTNCVLASASSVFRIGVGVGDIEHVDISHIVMRRGAVGFSLMCDWSKAYSTGIDDLRISDISAAELCSPLYIGGGAHKGIRHVRIEGYRAACSASANIRAANAALSGDILLRDCEWTMRDRDIEMTDEALRQRGAAMLNVDGMPRVTVDGLKLIFDEDKITNWVPIALKHCADFRMERFEMP